MQLEGATIPGFGPVSAPAATAPAATGQQGGWASTFQTILPGLTSTLLAAKQTRDLQKLNLARAKAGLPPLDIAAYQEASAPVIKVQGGVDSGTSSRLAWGIGGGLLLLGLIMANNRKGK